MNKESLEMANAIERGVSNALKKTTLKVSIESPIREVPKGVTLIEAARILHQHCNSQNGCYGCDLHLEGKCVTNSGYPEDWRI